MIPMNYIMLEPQVMELLKFQNKYGSFVKDQYLAEQATDLAKKQLKYETLSFKKKPFILENLMSHSLL